MDYKLNSKHHVDVQRFGLDKCVLPCTWTQAHAVFGLNSWTLLQTTSRTGRYPPKRPHLDTLLTGVLPISQNPYLELLFN